MRSRFDQSRDREGAVMSQVEWLLHRSTDRFLTGAAPIAYLPITLSEPLKSLRQYSNPAELLANVFAYRPMVRSC